MTKGEYQEKLRAIIRDLHVTFCPYEKRDAHENVIGEPVCDGHCNANDNAARAVASAVLLGAAAGKAGIIPVKL